MQPEHVPVQPVQLVQLVQAFVHPVQLVQLSVHPTQSPLHAPVQSFCAAFMARPSYTVRADSITDRSDGFMNFGPNSGKPVGFTARNGSRFLSIYSNFICFPAAGGTANWYGAPAYGTIEPFALRRFISALTRAFMAVKYEADKFTLISPSSPIPQDTLCRKSSVREYRRSSSRAYRRWAARRRDTMSR